MQLDQDEIVGAVLLDVSKYFNTRNLLIAKFDVYEFEKE